MSKDEDLHETNNNSSNRFNIVKLNEIANVMESKG
jgi:hypothetical protein